MPTGSKFCSLRCRLSQIFISKESKSPKLDEAEVNNALDEFENHGPNGPTLSAGSLTSQDVLSLFKLEEAKHRWNIDLDHLYPVPDALLRVLEDIQYVTKGSPPNEALTRTKVNLILISCIAAEKRLVDQVTSQAANTGDNRPSTPAPVPPAPVQLQFESKLTYPVEFNGEKRLYSGIADYSLWYESASEMGLNLVVMEAKKEYTAQLGEVQCLSYMGVVHRSRKTMGKANSSVYGICSDGLEFRFLHIDNESRVLRAIPLRWDFEGKEIVSRIRFIIRTAIESSPTTTPLRPLAVQNERGTPFKFYPNVHRSDDDDPMTDLSPDADDSLE